MKISVVVPVRNEEDSIRVLLDALLNQTRAPDEIVLTDGGSTDATARIIEEYMARGAPVRLVRTTFALPGRGRNLAADAACSEWLAFTDAGIRPDKDWLRALAERAMDEPKADVIYGAWQPVIDTFFKECAAIAYIPPPVDINGARVRPRSIVSSLMRKNVWRAVGGFPEHLRSAEDLLFMDKIEEMNFRIARAPSALVYWNTQPTLWRTFKRFVAYSRNNIRAGLWSRWQAAIFKRYALLVLYALLGLAFVRRWWLVTVVALWLVMLAARAALSLWRNRRYYPASAAHNASRLLLLVPLIATLDAAAIGGTINWLVADKLRLFGKTVDATDGA